jgi:LytS/YehU family sensor histidine kinase
VHEAAGDPDEAPSAVPIDDSFVRKTKLRLELLYPQRHGITISDKLEKGHEVTLTLPYSPVSDAVLLAEGAA